MALPIFLVLDGREYGGIEAHVCHLWRLLSQAGHCVTLLLWQRYDDGSFKTQLNLQQLPHIGLIGSPRQKLQQLRQLAQKGVLHSHGYKAGILCRLAALGSGRRAISTFHAGECGHGKLRCYQWLDRLSARSSINLAVSERIAAQLPGSPMVIKNFVTHIAAPRQATGTPLQIGFIGRYCLDKGLDRLVALAQQLPQFGWHSFGAGELAPLLTPSNIEDHGFCHQVDRALAQLDLLVLPSRYEGLPLVALEALAAGVPVVAFAVGDLAKLIDDRVGRLVPENELTQMAQALRQLAAQTPAQWQQLRSQGQARVQAQWQGQQTLSQCLSCYQSASQ
ncbi:glycosyltransferase family 4 protein [uncultured Ferrimonas sp.]|uniref:glycosyltransferase family 4 protein n=1 Tax=uncultured Ferrimonas sp. TaxID=432640 RepID=UPI00261E8418|nr:glycosyltransferase family 4 protein [uncultured Ferrimonas sp.]